MTTNQLSPAFQNSRITAEYALKIFYRPEKIIIETEARMYCHI